MKKKEINPFQNILFNHEIPPEIKQGIMQDITLLQLFGEMVNLFSGKMGETALGLLRKNKNINF